jgi:hypothetical protein
VVDEPTLPVRYRPTRKRSAARALRAVLVGLLWLLLAGLVAMSVVWLLPERQAGPAKETPATVIASVKEPSKPPRMTARPAVPAKMTSSESNDSKSGCRSWLRIAANNPGSRFRP